MVLSNNIDVLLCQAATQRYKDVKVNALFCKRKPRKH